MPTHLHPSAPTSVPTHVYRVHRPSAQTRYDFSSGFRSKNQTTIMNSLQMVQTFCRAHLTNATNISSPLISVYDDPVHAEHMARVIAQRYAEETWLVKIDTKHLARGPLFWAADILDVYWAEKRAGGEVVTEAEMELHRGEYLIMYKIPAQAIRDETRVAHAPVQRWRAVGDRA